jgi:hypothetical protein
MLRARLLAAASCLVVAVVPGCGQTATTQLIVVVDTDYAIPGGIDEIDVDVQGPDGMHHLEREPMASSAALPYTLTVVPRGSALGPIRIEATGLHAGTAVVSRVGRVTLVAQQTRMVRLDLLRACDAATTTCTGTDQTCGEDGRCGPIDLVPQAWTGTAPRIGEDTGVSLDAGTSTDASRPDASLDANLPDTGVPDDAAASDCHTLGCPDDGNPCTDEACGTDGRCTHPNNSNGCDDGMFCNGTDLCGAGSCSVHSGDPCGGATCDEAGRRCGSCGSDTDCPAPVMGTFGACGGFADGCATAGTHSRTIQTFHCTTGSCVATMTTDTQACTRASTDGNTCNTSSCTAYGRCSAATSDACSTAGMQSRTCTDYTCSAGACMPLGRSEMASCTLASTDGDSCGTSSCTAWSACTYGPHACSTAVMQSRTCTDYACSAGACATSMRTETMACPPQAPGTDCTNTLTQCGSYQCNASGICAAAGGQCTGPQPYCCHDAPSYCTSSSSQCFL